MIRFLIFFFAFLILTRFYVDPDLGWHLAIGRQYLSSGEIIRADQFSWTMPGFLWGNSYFAYQVIVAFLFEKLGHVIVTLIFGFVASLAILLLLPKKINHGTFLIAGLGAAMATANLAIRPHVFDFLLFAILLLCLFPKLFRKKIFIPFWFLFFAIWANLHVGFLVGLLVLAAFVLIDFLQRFSERKAFSWVGILAIFSAILGTLITPFNLQMWESILFDSGGPTAWLAIAEFLPAPIYFPLNLFYASSGVIFIYIFLKKMRKDDLPLFLVGAFLFMLPFLSIFYILFWSEIFIFIAARYVNLKFDLLKNAFSNSPVVLAILAVCSALVLNFFANFLESYKLRDLLRVDGYPVEAVDFLRNEKLAGNLFNQYEWGGFIDWQMPEEKVFIDGRMTGWRRADGRRILSDYLEILKGNCGVFNNYDIKVVLVKNDFSEKCFGNFREVYRDKTAKVLVRV